MSLIGISKHILYMNLCVRVSPEPVFLGKISPFENSWNLGMNK